MVTLLAFILAISFLVIVHELGHYTVARMCKVRILRFAVGFGRTLLKIKRGYTEWALCAIPLGGYVKMLDGKDQSIKAQDRPFAFDVQSLGKRMAIIVAGPLASLLVAVFLNAGALLGGEDYAEPLVGTVMPQTPAAMAGFVPGERIVSVEGTPVDNWTGVHAALLNSKNYRDLAIRVRTTDGKTMLRQLDLTRFLHTSNQPIQAEKIGLLAERVLPIVGFIDPKGPASHSPLKIGDQLIAVNDKPISHWEDFVASVHNNPGGLLDLTIKRNNNRIHVPIRLGSVNQQGFSVGYVGLGAKLDEAWHQHIHKTYQPNGVEALQQGFLRTVDTSWSTVVFIARLLIGDLSPEGNVMGPVSIARLAGVTAHLGWAIYLKFLALVSVSLGVLNLLPIPMLDGGYLMYGIIEWFMGRPISQRTQQKCNVMGSLLLMLILFFALFNDFMGLFAS